MIGPDYIGTTELPWPEGEHAGPEVRKDELGVDYQDGKWSLTGMSKEFTLFSAVSLAYSGIDFDPVALYWAETGLPASDTPFWVDVDRPILAGLAPPYDATLFACPKLYANGLISFLDRIAVNHPNGMIEAVRQRLPVVDWPLLKHVSVAPPAPPTVLVELYGLATKEGSYLWMTPQNPWKDPLTLQFRKVRPKVLSVRRST